MLSLQKGFAKFSVPVQRICILILIVAVFQSCDDGNLGVVFTPSSGVTITGNISFSVTSSIQSNQPFFNANIDQIAKVIAFYPGGEYFVSDVVDGSFSITVSAGNPVGLVFASSGNVFMGYITYGDGLDSLPLSEDEEGTTIDLGDLELNGSVIRSTHRPRNLTPAEIEALAQADNFFAAVVRNPDVNGDGAIDMLNGQRFYFIPVTSIGGLTIDRDTQQLSASGLSITNTSLYLVVDDPNNPQEPENVTFNIPGVGDLTSDHLDENHGDLDYCVDISGYPIEGNYTITGYGDGLDLYVADLSTIYESLIISVPQPVLNSDGELSKITWGYTLGNSDSTLDPSTIIKMVSVELYGVGEMCENGYLPTNLLHYSPNFEGNVTEYVLPEECRIDWNDLTFISVTFGDIYGCTYATPYELVSP